MSATPTFYPGLQSHSNNQSADPLQIPPDITTYAPDMNQVMLQQYWQQQTFMLLKQIQQ